MDRLGCRATSGPLRRGGESASREEGAWSQYSRRFEVCSAATCTFGYRCIYVSRDRYESDSACVDIRLITLGLPR